jgi:hypothetical protein
VIQTTVANLGRLDILNKTGGLDSLLRSGAKFSEKVLLLDAHHDGQTTTTHTVKIGPVLLLEKLWKSGAMFSARF